MATHFNLGKTFLLLGIAITLIGISVHVTCPTELSSVHFHLDSGEKYVQQYKISRLINEIYFMFLLGFLIYIYTRKRKTELARIITSTG